MVSWFGIVALLIGIAALYFGFRRYKQYHLVRSIPTSKIRSIAMGLVEAAGKVKKFKNTFVSPLSNEPCVYWRVLVERCVHRRRSAHWETVVNKGSGTHFLLKDETGEVLVDPSGAEMNISPDMKVLWNPSFWKSITFRKQETPVPLDYLRDYMGRNPRRFDFLKLGMKDILNNPLLYPTPNGSLRYTEWVVKVNQPLYVMGTAGDNPFKKEGTAVHGVEDVMISGGGKPLTELGTEKIKTAAAVEVSTGDEEAAGIGIENREVHTGGNFFYISDKPERTVLNSLRLGAYLGLFLGFIFTVYGFYLIA